MATPKAAATPKPRSRRRTKKQIAWDKEKAKDRTIRAGMKASKKTFDNGVMPNRAARRRAMKA